MTVPAEAENIHKDYVFKLHFKSHVYYFRSESEYTFERCRRPPRHAPAFGSAALNWVPMGSIRLEEEACYLDNRVILVAMLGLRWHPCR